MFKNKHVFTCPDILYLQERQKKYNKIILAIYGTFFTSLFVGGKILEARDARELKNTEPPIETQE